MELIKIEEELHEGEVLYHKLVEKTEAEKKAIKKAREKRKREREHRRKEQEKNVRKKEDAKEEHKKKSIEGMKVSVEDSAYRNITQHLSLIQGM